MRRCFFSRKWVELAQDELFSVFQSEHILRVLVKLKSIWNSLLTVFSTNLAKGDFSNFLCKSFGSSIVSNFFSPECRILSVFSLKNLQEKTLLFLHYFSAFKYLFYFINNSKHLSLLWLETGSCHKFVTTGINGWEYAIHNTFWSVFPSADSNKKLRFSSNKCFKVNI